VARGSEITFVSVPTPAIMEAVAAEWLGAAEPGAVLVDLTTNAPETVRRVGARLAAAGRHLLEAPLTGGTPGAKARMPPKGHCITLTSAASAEMRDSRVDLPAPRSPPLAKTPPPGSSMR